MYIGSTGRDVANMLDERIRIQKHLRVWNAGESHKMKFHKEKCKILHLGLTFSRATTKVQDRGDLVRQQFI